MTMKLYTFFRSGTSHRLRIALNLKGLSYEQSAVDLRREEHLGDAFKAINPQQFVPVVEADGHRMTQSPATRALPPATCTFDTSIFCVLVLKMRTVVSGARSSTRPSSMANGATAASVWAVSGI